MTFEEFIAGKRIDLTRAETEFPALIKAMRNHFRLLGAAATDQFYKFRFNELRRACPAMNL